MRRLKFRLRTLMLAIGGIGLWLGLARAHPDANAWLILSACFAGPPAYLVRRRLAQMKVEGESLSFDDRIALFLCLSLFTVPIVMLFLVLCLFLFAPLLMRGIS
jgi:hypothetical protein